MADSDWLEGAELLSLEWGVDTNVLNTAISAPIVIVSDSLLIQIDLEYTLGVSPYPSVSQVFDLGIGIVVEPTIVPPEVFVFALGFNSTELLFGLMKDPTWVVSFICQQKALQYWG